MRNLVTAFALSLLYATSASAMANMSGAPPSIPEPAAAAVFGFGAVVVGYAIHRRRAK